MLLGDPRPAITEAFFAVLGTDRNFGWLGLQGDSLEFGIRMSRAWNCLMVMEMTIRPRHPETTKIAIDGADHVVFASGLDPRPEYLDEVRRLAGPAPCEVVRWPARPDNRAPELVAVACRAANALLPGPSETQTSWTGNLPYLPSTFAPCYEGEVSGWGVGGQDNRLREDIRFPQRPEDDPVREWATAAMAALAPEPLRLFQFLCCVDKMERGRSTAPFDSLRSLRARTG